MGRFSLTEARLGGATWQDMRNVMHELKFKRVAPRQYDLTGRHLDFNLRYEPSVRSFVLETFRRRVRDPRKAHVRTDEVGSRDEGVLLAKDLETEVEKDL